MSTETWVRGSWMQTFTGRQFYPLAPEVDDIDIADIAHALSLICRYGGHVDRFYSVAEHCVLVSQSVPAHDAMWGLLHDAAEAYVGDMVRPLKHHMPDYRLIEDRLLRVIAEHFGMKGASFSASVKDADNRILLTERAALMSAPPVAWQQDGLQPLDVEVRGLAPADAEALFLAQFEAVTP